MKIFMRYLVGKPPSHKIILCSGIAIFLQHYASQSHTVGMKLLTIYLGYLKSWSLYCMDVSIQCTSQLRGFQYSTFIFALCKQNLYFRRKSCRLIPAALLI